MENIIVSEICKKCGECCKHYPFVELSKAEIVELGKLTGLPFSVFTNKVGKAVEKFFLQFKENGDCFFLNENDGGYSCGVYEARSEICRNYPSGPHQNEVCNANRALILRNNPG